MRKIIASQFMTSDGVTMMRRMTGDGFRLIYHVRKSSI